MQDARRFSGCWIRRPTSQSARYLRDLLARFANDVVLALAAYNAGEQVVGAYARVPPYPETQAYVRVVEDFYQLFRPPPAGPKPPRTPSRIAIPRPAQLR